MTMTVQRGPESWQYIYTTLGFALTIEATIISMVEPLWWLWKLAAYAVISIITFLTFIRSGRFQNKLIGWKTAYEAKGWTRW